MNLGTEIPCPTCESPVLMTPAQVAAKRPILCPRGHQIDVEDEGGRLADADQAMKDFDESIEKLGRTINFKL